jgi:NAD+ synthase (glutamine-hydrolysing)
VSRLRIAACQLDLVVGDLDGNVAAMLKALERAESEGCDLAVFPEMAITGYPPEDLLLKPGFVADNRAALDKLASGTGRCAAVVGFVDAGRDLHNAAAVCAEGAVQGVYHKRLLPNYAVFDEQRYFAPGVDDPKLFLIGGVRVGVSICEDVWSPTGPVTDQATGGAELILNISASPFHAGKLAERERMLATRAADASCALVYVNLVGGQDELVFDGASLVVDSDGSIVARAPQFVEDVMVVDVEVRPVFRKRLLDPRGRARAPALESVTVSADARSAGSRDPNATSGERREPPLAEPLDPVHEIYEALVIGTRDYVRKTGFDDVVVGLSGGIDSSIVAVIAVDALGAEHVHGVAMPSRFSSESSNTDAEQLAENLGIDFRVIAIEPAHAAFLDMLASSFEGTEEDITEENIQARARGIVLMALSNKFKWMVLATGNKSEMAAGFATLYGDMAGGFAVIKDVRKTLVYDLCRDRNRRAGLRGPNAAGGDHPPIPESVLDKPPSAELKADQRDDQSLPPYEELDPVLEAYIEGDATAVDLERQGFDGELVRRVVGLVDRAEYKRRQAPPGVRVTPKAFGKDRRLPITNRYR